MLILSRKCNESVVVGGGAGGVAGFGVTVTVMEVKAGKVRLGFDAAPAVSVHRGEVWARIITQTGQLSPRNELPGTADGSIGIAS